MAVEIYVLFKAICPDSELELILDVSFADFSKPSASQQERTEPIISDILLGETLAILHLPLSLVAIGAYGFWKSG